MGFSFGSCGCRSPGVDPRSGPGTWGPGTDPSNFGGGFGPYDIAWVGWYQGFPNGGYSGGIPMPVVRGLDIKVLAAANGYQLPRIMLDTDGDGWPDVQGQSGGLLTERIGRSEATVTAEGAQAIYVEHWPMPIPSSIGVHVSVFGTANEYGGRGEIFDPNDTLPNITWPVRKTLYRVTRQGPHVVKIGVTKNYRQPPPGLAWRTRVRFLSTYAGPTGAPVLPNV